MITNHWRNHQSQASPSQDHQHDNNHQSLLLSAPIAVISVGIMLSPPTNLQTQCYELPKMKSYVEIARNYHVWDNRWSHHQNHQAFWKNMIFLRIKASTAICFPPADVTQWCSPRFIPRPLETEFVIRVPLLCTSMLLMCFITCLQFSMEVLLVFSWE